MIMRERERKKFWCEDEWVREMVIMHPSSYSGGMVFFVWEWVGWYVEESVAGKGARESTISCVSQKLIDCPVVRIKRSFCTHRH